MQQVSSSRIEPASVSFQQQSAPAVPRAMLATLRTVAISLLVDRALSA